MTSLEEIRNQAMQLGMDATGWLLIVDAGTQQMYVTSQAGTMETLPVATSKFGLGNVLESYRTPTGFMEVVERYGEGLEPGAVLFEREATGECLSPDSWRQASGRDYILTRILRLSGLEEGVNRGGNVDTFERYVYIHGSDCEQHLGEIPASHGCIHVGNLDIVGLFDRLKNAPVWCWVGEEVDPPT